MVLTKSYVLFLLFRTRLNDDVAFKNNLHAIYWDKGEVVLHSPLISPFSLWECGREGLIHCCWLRCTSLITNDAALKLPPFCRLRIPLETCFEIPTFGPASVFKKHRSDAFEGTWADCFDFILFAGVLTAFGFFLWESSSLSLWPLCSNLSSLSLHSSFIVKSSSSSFSAFVFLLVWVLICDLASTINHTI